MELQELIRKKYNIYKQEYEKLLGEKNQAFKEHMEYCERNKNMIPRPTYRHFDDKTESGRNMLFWKMQALEEFLN